MSVIGGVLANYFYSRGVKSASRQNYLRAERNLERAFGHLGILFPSRDVPVSFNLLTSLIKLRLGDFEMAESGAALAKEVINADEQLHPSFRDYLNIYANRIIRVSRWHRDLPYDDIPDEPRWEEVERVRLRVPAAYRQVFTLPKPGS